ncbi:CRISPR-associated helicase Cas3' [Paenibacillus chungangensis]|uniref:CRISPR-associated helicase Cas3 n=1 Tax=Paenibacillus chungangensis TaxID=696535 RepID=A0ABW3HR84_9BACL
MSFYAHTKEEGQPQLLLHHLENVARLAEQYANVFGAGHLGYIAGLMHDLGKYSDEFQQRLAGSKRRVDHSTAGARWALHAEWLTKYKGATGLDAFFAKLVSMAIAGHHGGLRNYGTKDAEGTYWHRIARESPSIPSFTAAWGELHIKEMPRTIPQGFAPRLLCVDNLGWKYSFLGRMIYSSLVDADSVDTRDYCNDGDRLLMENRSIPSMQQLFERLQLHLKSFSDADDSVVNRQRQNIQQTCLRQAELPPGLFSLSVPTGGGKTFSSLAFALKHASLHGKRRVIYVIPFTSIIDQTARHFRKAVGDEAVLEHHSNFNHEEYSENYDDDEIRRLKLSTENWDMPIIVTTSVQFFESLFANQRSKCRKLHHIADAVVVLDEAQSLPRGYMAPCLRALEELVESYGCTTVLCTATQPPWEQLGAAVTEMMDRPTPQELFHAFKRVEISSHGSPARPIGDETVVDWILSNRQLLCIVNTRRHAKELYDRLKGEAAEGLYHLSGRMCARHRQEVLEEIKERLIDQLPCRLISTQLIEAGVDIDFPIVLRAMAGLDSIAQAAGRCNREGKRDKGEVRVFYPEQHGMPSRGWMKETATEASNVMRYVHADPLSQEAMDNYFDRIYGLNGTPIAVKQRFRSHNKLIDSEGILDLLWDKRKNGEIPFQEIAERVQFNDDSMRAIIVPYDEKAVEWIEELKGSPYPNKQLRALQPYSVQVYQHELTAMLQADLLRQASGALYLTDASYYNAEAGLLQADASVEQDILIF